MTQAERKFDKSNWGAGPWQSEPDRFEWRHRGYPCLALRSLATGSWCGYVGVDESHPLYGQTRVDEILDVHGGVTWTALCEADICHEPRPGEPDTVWWIGFDCGHAFDYLPKLYGDCGIGIDAFAKYRNLPYVRYCVQRLVRQLKHLKDLKAMIASAICSQEQNLTDHVG